MSTRWAPPLPSIGRCGPRILVEPSSTYLAKLDNYYTSFRSVPDIFVRRIQPAEQVKLLGSRGAPKYLSEFDPGAQQRLLLKCLYYKTSKQFRLRLRDKLRLGHLSQVRQWWHTATAVVLPLLISSVEEPTFEEVDKLVRFALENCANNYAQFQSDLKSLKKAIRKAFATTGKINVVACKSTMLSYLRSCQKKQDFDGPADFGRYILLWTQTRATGLADGVMVRKSIDKFISTIQEPEDYVPVNPAVLIETLGGAHSYMGELAKVSVGTTACLERTRQEGGKTQLLKDLTRSRSLKGSFNYETLEFSPFERARPVRSSKDILDWAVYDAIYRPVYTRTVRVHAVVEPSKARTITVAPYGYQVIMGVFSHVYQATLKSRSVRSGLRADRHLWRFLQDNLNPQNTLWGKLEEGNIFALSTDLEEATDFGNKRFAKDVLFYMIKMTPNMPLGLSMLMRTLFTSKRFVWTDSRHGRGLELTIAKRSWFMGDMMTKFMLTVGHDYCCRLSLLEAYTLVGDDEIALSSNRRQLERHLENLELLFKVSRDDTYISNFFAFYCEEGTILPQYAHESNHVRMRRGRELLYLDYPRIRLLIPTASETDAYSATNVGRFALLGKEARWVDTVNVDAKRLFTMASLYQHLLVPQDKDTLCPFTPLEMAGDGAFPHDPTFLKKVVGDKSRDPRETMFRMSSLLNDSFSHKFIRSERLDKVVNKHHLYLPKLEGLRKLIPQSSVIEPKTDEAKLMLHSMRFRDIETPQQTFLRLCKGFYYKSLLQGKDPVEPVFNIDRKFSAGHTEDPTVDYLGFIEKWRNPGFKFQDVFEYFVLKSETYLTDPMSLGWSWDPKLSQPSSRDLFNDWAEREISFEDTSLPAILDMIKNQTPLPPRVVDRLNLFMESDNYILHTYKGTDEFAGVVTRDIRLCLKVKQAMDGRDRDKSHKVVAIDPALYLTGRAFEIMGRRLRGWYTIPEDMEMIPDPGAMLHVDYNEFTDGFPHREDIFDCELDLTESRHTDVYIFSPTKPRL
jgi:hypothetical protein